jgi:hypothetical protein|tara:strand:+ start:1447 stop:3240 length:1794 start_codon:yes stop_codon:yes gene_type:complete
MKLCKFNGVSIYKVATLCLFLFLLLNPVAQGQEISVTATVDKNRLSLEDVLQLSIVIQGTQNTPPPELPSLPDFRVVSAGTSSSTQYINTQRSVSITYNYRLTPMNTGTFVIGPTRVRANGKTYATQPITIAVQNEAQKPSNQETTGNKNAFVVTTLSSKKAYVGEQLVYTFRLFHRVDAKNLNLRLPFDKTRFHKEELGEPKTYIKINNGLQYHVQELSLALFPLKKGLHEIPSAMIELDLFHPMKNRSRRDPFSQFFGQRTQAEHKVLRSQSLSIEVLPLPDGAPEGFENIIGQFNISAELGKNDLEVGDTTTLTVTVSGKGNVQDIIFDEPDLKSYFKIYPDKPEFHQTVQNNQIMGEKVFKFALVPLEAGSRTLPKFSLAFFDPGKAQYRVAQTQPISLNIKPSAAKEELNLVQSRQQNAQAPEIEILGRDIFPIYTELDKFQNARSHSPAFLATRFGSPVLLFFISAFIIKRQRRMKHDVAFYRRRNAYKNATRRLKKMSEHSDPSAPKEFGRELSEILREYVGNKLNLQGKAITAEEVETRLKEADYESAEVTRKLLERCEILQFAPTTRGNTKELLRESENLIKLLEKQS